MTTSTNLLEALPNQLQDCRSELAVCKLSVIAVNYITLITTKRKNYITSKRVGSFITRLSLKKHPGGGQKYASHGIHVAHRVTEEEDCVVF